MKKDILSQILTGKFLEAGLNFYHDYLLKLELDPSEKVSQAIVQAIETVRRVSHLHCISIISASSRKK